VRLSTRVQCLCLALLLLPLGAAWASAASPAPMTPATQTEAAPAWLPAGPAHAIPVLTCGPGLILGTYTAYYSDPAKTMFVCEKSCGDTTCTRFTPYFTTSQTCCLRQH
jgi:hypothetical protein